MSDRPTRLQEPAPAVAEDIEEHLEGSGGLALRPLGVLHHDLPSARLARLRNHEAPREKRCPLLGREHGGHEILELANLAQDGGSREIATNRTYASRSSSSLNVAANVRAVDAPDAPWNWSNASSGSENTPP